MGAKKTEEEKRRQRQFGVRVYSLRAEQGLSQEDVMNYGGLERSFISNVENGVHAISSSRVYDLAEGLRVDPVDLFEYEGEKTPRYLQLADYLKLEVNAGLLRVEDLLRPRAELCRHYGYSRFAVAKALALLRHQSIVQPAASGRPPT